MSNPIKKSSGLSTHHRPAPPTNTEPTEVDMEKMPLEQLRQLANKQLANHN
jgi:hypothetical protein